MMIIIDYLKKNISAAFFRNIVTVICGLALAFRNTANAAPSDQGQKRLTKTTEVV